MKFIQEQHCKPPSKMKSYCIETVRTCSLFQIDLYYLSLVICIAYIVSSFVASIQETIYFSASICPILNSRVLKNLNEIYSMSSTHFRLIFFEIEIKFND